MDILRFDNFARTWTDGLPTGNGRLAAMLWGDEEKDVISLNHEWLWTGSFKDRECDEGAHFLPIVRDYLKKGENFKATALAAIAFGGNGGISPLQRRMDSYQPAGDIIFSHAHSKSVSRALDIKNGLSCSEKTGDSPLPKLTVLCHAVSDVFAMSWQSEMPFSGILSFNRDKADNVTENYCTNYNKIEYSCNGGNGVGFKVLLLIKTDGEANASDNKITIKNATYINVTANIGTEHHGIEKELAKEPDLYSNEFLNEHKKAFSKAIDKWVISLGDENTPELAKMPVNKRALRMKNGESDAQMISIYARFGVYLMVAGSLLAQLPLHLQGKWNAELSPKWNSDYHFNINLQMNYWFADMLSMDKYSRLMTDYVLTLLPKARIAAKKLYGCRGILYPLNSDIWANVTSEAYNYSVWISAAGWLASHFYNTFLHTGDNSYLSEYAYPFFKEVALFYEDYIVIDDNNIAQLMPSQSPENKYEGCGYFPVSMCISSAMDVQIAYDLLGFAVQSARELNVDQEKQAKWNKLRESLPEFKIGADGRLLEWDTDDKIEIEKGHRHVSHLYGVYPSSLFTPEKRQKQFEAARKSLEYRLANSGGHTGWSTAWSACLYARFLDGANVNKNLRHLICAQSSSSLLDLHPDYYPASRAKNKKPADEPVLFTAPQENPPMIFQIDGNLGASAALIEALVQYRENKIYLLPALDSSWKNGSLSGIRTKGGHVLSFSFENNKINNLTLVMGFEEKVVFANMSDNKSDLCVKGKKGDLIKII